MRRVTITIADETLARVQRAVHDGGAPSVSAYLSGLAEQHTREDELSDLLDRLDAELGEPSAEDVAWARRVTQPEA